MIRELTIDGITIGRVDLIREVKWEGERIEIRAQGLWIPLLPTLGRDIYVELERAVRANARRRVEMN